MIKYFIYLMTRRKTTEQFIQEAKQIHGDKYDYSQVEYTKAKIKVKIFCNKCHIFFEQTPDSHITKKAGHNKCSRKKGLEHPKTKKLEKLLIQFKKIHNNKYNYSYVVYENSKTNIKIYCNECKNFFYQRPDHHRRGSNCNVCSKNKQLTNKEFIQRAKKIHGDKYDYSQIEYKNTKTKVKIFCKKCQKYFKQIASDHINNKSGCFNCCGNKRKTTEQFIQKAKQIHGDKYDYSKVNYIQNKKPVIIICKKHGEFEQRPNNHVVLKYGCRYCNKSRGEEKIKLYFNKILEVKGEKTFKNLYIKKNNKRTPLRYDFYCENLNLLIEYDGIQHFKDNTTNKHFDKNFQRRVLKDCKKNYYAISNGYNLLRIAYTEFNFIESIIESTISKIKNTESQVIIYSNPRLYRRTYRNRFLF